MSLGKRLSYQRKIKGFTQTQLAKAVGVSQQAIERIEAGVTENPRKIVMLAKALGVTPNWLLLGDDTGEESIVTLGATDPNTDMVDFVGERGGQALGADGARVPVRDLPVLGLAQGGAEGALVMEADPIDWIFRPPALDRVESAFAVFVTGSSMEPRYFAGDILYVHPGKPVRAGRHVLVETSSHEGFIKRFDAWRGDELHLHQYNPDGPLVLHKADVLRVLLVIGVMEDG